MADLKALRAQAAASLEAIDAQIKAEADTADPVTSSRRRMEMTDTEWERYKRSLGGDQRARGYVRGQ